MRERMGIMHKHVGDQLHRVKTFRTGEMQAEQVHQINPHPWQYKAGYPKKDVNDDQIFCYRRNRTEESRTVLSRHISIILGDKGIYILRFSGCQPLKHSISAKKNRFSLLYFKINLHLTQQIKRLL
jgi:hypothetical protein